MQNLAARDTFLMDIKQAFKNISIVPYLKSRRNRIKTLFPSYDKHTYAYTFTHTFKHIFICNTISFKSQVCVLSLLSFHTVLEKLAMQIVKKIRSEL